MIAERRLSHHLSRASRFAIAATAACLLPLGLSAQHDDQGAHEHGHTVHNKKMVDKLVEEVLERVRAELSREGKHEHEEHGQHGESEGSSGGKGKATTFEWHSDGQHSDGQRAKFHFRKMFKGQSKGKGKNKWRAFTGGSKAKHKAHSKGKVFYINKDGSPFDTKAFWMQSGKDGRFVVKGKDDGNSFFLVQTDEHAGKGGTKLWFGKSSSKSKPGKSMRLWFDDAGKAHTKQLQAHVSGDTIVIKRNGKTQTTIKLAKLGKGHAIDLRDVTETHSHDQDDDDDEGEAKQSIRTLERKIRSLKRKLERLRKATKKYGI